MQTQFTPEQLDNPENARSNEILRSCVHCGFCTATCPTYLVLGDELDSPRGRIYLIKDMLENERVPDAATVGHIDRCLSCLSCMTTCPSGVHYMHLVDHARSYIEQNYRRPLSDRVLRGMLAAILPYPARFRLALRAGALARPLRRLLPDARLRAMLDMVPRQRATHAPNADRQALAAEGKLRKRVMLMPGCAQQALNSDINDAAIRLLRRHGCEVVVAGAMGCCGALPHHMGKTAASHEMAARMIRKIAAEDREKSLDAVVITASGCGTTIKDYGHMFRNDPLAEKAARVSALARDVTEIMADLGLHDAGHATPLRVGYHAACSLQHGQQVRSAPKELLTAAGFTVLEPGNSHICCGSAGTYNLLQPEIAGQLKRRKVDSLETLAPDVISAGNIGCMMQIGSGTGVPVVHTVELLDWATGGMRPAALAAL